MTVNDDEVIEVLLYTEQGETYSVRPQHGDQCSKGKSLVTSAFTCDGCKFDVLSQELLQLVRPEVVSVNVREGVPHEDCR